MVGGADTEWRERIDAFDPVTVEMSLTSRTENHVVDDCVAHQYMNPMPSWLLSPSVIPGYAASIW